MAVRYPLVIDTTDNNKIKELPLNDSLNLSSNSIVNAVNITASGTLTVANLVVDTNSVSINGNSIATVALTNSYTDLSNKPSLFDGQYASLTGRPTIVSTTEDLADVSSTQATNGQALIYNSTSGVYEPGSIADAALDLTSQSISELADVAVISISTNQVLKWTGATFTNSNIAFSELTGTPTTLLGYGITNAYTKAEVDAQISAPTGDLTGSVFADDSTVLVDGVNGKITGEVTGTISSTNWMASSDSYLTISNGGATGPGPIQIVASANLDLASGNNNDINMSPHGSGRVKVSDGGLGIVEAATFIGHADETMYLSSKTTGAQSTHITLNSTSGVQTTLFGAVDFVSGGSVDFTGSTVTGLNVTGDITGSVFGDDSTLIVDGVNNTINGIVQGGLQELVGPGVVNLTTTSTEIVTTGTDAYTLANGTYGQIKHIIKIGGPGAATITPASFANGTSVELASDFNCVSLLYTNSGWAVIAAQNITINA